jgi:YD repeat-containing protein
MPGRAKRRQSANSIIAATARVGKDVKIDYDGDGKIKSITTITPGRPVPVEANGEGGGPVVETPGDLRELL